MRPALKTGLVLIALAAAAPVIAGVSRHVPLSFAGAAAEEAHPEIKDAIKALQRAKTHLQKAAHDFGGHRVDAIHAIDQALEQLNTCLQYDK